MRIFPSDLEFSEVLEKLSNSAEVFPGLEEPPKSVREEVFSTPEASAVAISMFEFSMKYSKEKPTKEKIFYVNLAILKLHRG